MHKLESVQENETQKILGDFEIQTDHLIQTRQLNLVLINKSVFNHFSRPQNENKRKQKDAPIRSSDNRKKLQNMKMMLISKHNCWTGIRKRFFSRKFKWQQVSLDF